MVGDYGSPSLQVQAGDMYIVDNQHRFIAGDVRQQWHRFKRPVDVIYTDPPWNTGNRKMFHSFAGVAVNDTFRDFLRGLTALMKTMCPSGVIAIDMGISEFETLTMILHEAGATTWAIGQTTYGSPKRPCGLWIGTFGSEKREIEIPKSLHGKQVISWVMQRFITPGCHYFDPCCGQLVFVKEAMKRGAIAQGCELIPNKLAKGLLSLENKYPIRRINDAEPYDNARRNAEAGHEQKDRA